MANIGFEQIGSKFKAWQSDSYIVFEQTSSGTRLVHISSQNGENFLRVASPIWKIEFIDKNNQVFICENTANAEITNEEAYISLRWKHLAIQGTDGVDIGVKVSFEKDGLVGWQITIENLSESLSIFRVFFPMLSLAVEKNDKYSLIVPVDTGVAYRNPLKSIPTGGAFETKKLRERLYPNCLFTMQFMALQREDELFYFAAYDYDCNVKCFHYEPDLENSAVLLNPTVPTPVAYGMPYTSFKWVMICTSGDWYDASQIYRRFAVKAPWTQKGPLESGNKTPKWYQNCPIVSLRLNRGTGYETSDIISEKQFFNIPMVVHYYMWHKNAFDAGNPFFFPTVPGFRTAVRELRDQQIYVMPYVNPYSCDTSLEEWEQGFKNCAMKIKPNGELGVSVWSQGKIFAAMCLNSSLWKRFINLLAMRFFEMGINTLYFDEIGASSAYPCYSHEHGHVSGGGNHYVRAYCDLFEKIRDEASEFNSDMIFSSESCSEPFICHMDSLLMGNNNDPQGIPLFQAVYHDYIMGFGRYVFTVELVDKKFSGAIISKFAQQFIWGNQFGWSRIPLNAIIKKDPKTAEFLKHLAHTWVLNSKYIACGKMLRPLNLADQLEKVKRKWAMAWNDNEGAEVELPAVLNSIWQIDDGSIAVVLVNITDSDIKLNIKLPSYQDILAQAMADKKDVEIEKMAMSRKFYPLPQGTIGILRTTAENKSIETVCDGDSENGFQVIVPALRSAVIIIGSEKQYGVHHF